MTEEAELCTPEGGTDDVSCGEGLGEGDGWTWRDVRERVGFSAARVERRCGDGTGVVERDGVLEEESSSITIYAVERTPRRSIEHCLYVCT